MAELEVRETVLDVLEKIEKGCMDELGEVENILTFRNYCVFPKALLNPNGGGSSVGLIGMYIKLSSSKTWQPI